MAEDEVVLGARWAAGGQQGGSGDVRPGEPVRQTILDEHALMVERERTVTRAEELARAHHGAMGAAMRSVSGQPVLVGPWAEMPLSTQLVCVAAMRKLLDDGVLS